VFWRKFANFVAETMVRSFVLHIIVGLLLLVPLCMRGEERFVVVLDAGHGGHDPGTIGSYAKEKDVNLGVVLKLGDLIAKSNDDVRVVYTRKGDYFKTLQERCDIANNAHGDLFISVHVNSVDKSAKNRTSVHGAATYTLGLHRSAENLAVAKRENAVMMLENDYSERYCGFDPNSSESYIIFELNQNKHLDQSIDFAGRVQKEMRTTAGRTDNGVRQAGFWVLAKTSMPAVLVELDYICNPESETFLTSEAGQSKLAKAICNAFADYKRTYDATTGNVKAKSRADSTKTSGKRSAKTADKADKTEKTEKPEKAEPSTTTATTAATAKTGKCYRVQFMTSPKQVAKGSDKFRGVTDYLEYRDGKTWKYSSGDLSSWSAARQKLAELRKKFPDAFIITVIDGQRVK
jgi:N-acetylmuramoyl-L-alanine amidase